VTTSTIPNAMSTTTTNSERELIDAIGQLFSVKSGNRRPLARKPGTTEIHVHSGVHSKIVLTPTWLEYTEGRQFKCEKSISHKESLLALIGTTVTTHVYEVDVEKHLPYTISGKHRIDSDLDTYWDLMSEDFGVRSVTALTPYESLIMDEVLTPREVKDIIDRDNCDSLYSLPFKWVDRLDLTVDKWNQHLMVDSIAKIHGNDIFQHVKHLTVHYQTTWNRVLEYEAPKVEYLKIEHLKSKVKSKIPGSVKTLHIERSACCAQPSSVFGDFFVDTIVIPSGSWYRLMEDVLKHCRRLVIKCDRYRVNLDETFHDRSRLRIEVPKVDDVTTEVITYRVCKARGADPEDCYDFNFSVEKN